MKKIIFLITLMIVIVSCEKETFKYYSFDFYPIEEINNSGNWIETDFLSKETLTFQLNSHRVLEEFHDFEPIDIPTCVLIMNKDFIVNTDTIESGSNLLEVLDEKMISFSQHIGENGKEYSWYYLKLKSTNTMKINIPNDYYELYIKGMTKNGFEINDSLLFKYNKYR